MDLTSTFTALLPGDEGDTEEMTRTHKHTSKETLGGTHIQHPHPPPPHPDTPALQHIHLTLMFVFKIQLPTYWYFTGIFKMQTRAVISQGSHWFLFMSQPRGPTPPRLFLPLLQCIFAWLTHHTHTHTHIHTHKNKHICTSHPLPQPMAVQEVSLLIGNQSKIIH